MKWLYIVIVLISFQPFWLLLFSACGTKEKRNITPRRWSTNKIYKILHQNQLPLFMRTLICRHRALLFKAPWQCARPLFMSLLSHPHFVIQNLQSLSNRGEAAVPQREIKDGEEGKTKIEREQKRRGGKSTAFVWEPCQNKSCTGEKKNIPWNNTLASHPEMMQPSSVTLKCQINV